MARGDGTNPKFRILCKRCNSYQHTAIFRDDEWSAYCIACSKCGNVAENFKEEFEDEASVGR